MSHLPTAPNTSSAVPLALRQVTSSGGLAATALKLPKDGLSYAPLLAHTCPACGLRPPLQELHKFTLRGISARVEWVDRLSSPPVVMGAALWAGFLGAAMWWPLLFMLGPLAAISNAATARWMWSPRFRLKVSLCPACAAEVRRARRSTRVARTVKNLAAWSLVMLAPSMFAAVPGMEQLASLGLLGPLAGVMGVVSSVAYLVERARRKVADGMLPALVAVTPDHVQLVAPARWMPVLETAPDVALLAPR